MSSYTKYGYSYTDDKHTRYKVNEEEVAVIKRIDLLYLAGYGQQTIADMLTDSGVPTPMGKGVWSRQTVGYIIDCTDYHSESYAFKGDTVISEEGKKRTRLKPIAERIKLPSEVCPQIRTYETYLALQERRKYAHSTAVTSKLRDKQVLLRGGYIRCSVCGNAMMLIHNSASPVYACIHNGNSIVQKHILSISAKRIESAVIDFLRNLLKDLNTIERALTDYIEIHEAQNSIEMYDNAISRIKEQQAELTNDLKSVKGNARQLILGQLNAMEDELEKMQTYRSKIIGDGSRWELIRSDIEAVISQLRTGSIDIDNADFKEKRRILKVLGIQVIISRIEHNRYARLNRNAYEIRVTLPTLQSVHTFANTRSSLSPIYPGAVDRF